MASGTAEGNVMGNAGVKAQTAAGKPRHGVRCGAGRGARRDAARSHRDHSPGLLHPHIKRTAMMIMRQVFAVYAGQLSLSSRCRFS